MVDPSERFILLVDVKSSLIGPAAGVRFGEQQSIFVVTDDLLNCSRF